ncbi:MAG: undecaprenyl/decaprenyl-phosphate alpha-N-acetylglucosaminyl 1-phosphate transferase [Paludibacteraceae bacterium]|nr:undecaprenyl/decaprenyl-phosphate alpha-N-acetylglucosaminyl 1-phosphate transferase [Paludibacteraceae bacterium]
MNYLYNFIQQFPYLLILFSFLLGKAFMPSVVRIAKKHNFVVKPNKRTTHKGLIPYTGGFDIFISFIFTILIFCFPLMEELQYIPIGVFIILMTGFIDDLLNIKPTSKILGEFVAGIFLIVFSDIRITNFFGVFGIHELPLSISYIFSFLVFLLMVNSINLIDGVDGLASGLEIFYNLFFGIYFHLTGNVSLAIIAYTLTGSLAVFFIYNVFSKKNKVFMGDTGSLFLGFMLTFYLFEFCEMNASHSVPQSMYMAAAPAVAICVLIVPLYDTLRVMVTRIKKGVSPFKADRNHIHHLLLKIGFSHRKVTFVLLAITGFFTAFGLLARQWPNLLLVFVAFLLATGMIFWLWRVINRKMLRK